MEEQWAWLTNYKSVYTGPSVSLHRQRSSVSPVSCHGTSGLETFLLYGDSWDGSPFVILSLCIWKSMSGEIDSTRGQMCMLKLINGNYYVKAGDEIRTVWSNLKRFHHILAAGKNLMHFFLTSILHSDFFFFLSFLGELVFFHYFISLALRMTRKVRREKKVSSIHMPFVLIFCYPKQLY